MDDNRWKAKGGMREREGREAGDEENTRNAAKRCASQFRCCALLQGSL